MNTEKLRSFVRKHLLRKLESEIDDVVQQTLITAWQQQGSFRGQSEYSTWVFGIARNLCSNINLRQGPRLDLVINVDFLDESESGFVEYSTNRSPEAVLNGKQSMTAIIDAVMALPKIQRMAVELAADGASYDEIAAIQGVPIGTVRSRINRGRATLAEVLQ